MTDKRRRRQGGRVTPKGTRPKGASSSRADRQRDGRVDAPSGEPDLVLDIRRALAADHPLDLLAEASTLLAATDPRSRHPFERDPEPSGLARDEVMRSFLEVDITETSALLAVLAELDDDQLQRARVQRELRERVHPLPSWIGALGETEVYRAVEMGHILGDGENIFLGTRVSGRHELSFVVYVDHNVGTVVKDAFVVPGSLESLIDYMRAKADDADTIWSDIDPADARARLDEAITTGTRTWPPFETDTWPACRPLVQWVVGLMPEGGQSYQRPEWDDAELAALAERFFDSRFGAGLDDPDHRSLLDSILWFGSGYGPGDPLRWSSVAVEILLADWIPRKIVADAGYLAKAPDVLRPFIRFSHDERGIRPGLTAETLAAVDRWEPEYQQMIRSPRPQGPEALLAAMGLDLESVEGQGDEPPGFRELALEPLRRAVGGADALDQLDDLPLPDEPFDWEGIDDDIRDRIGEVVGLCDGYAGTLDDVEYRTAGRRLLARVARLDPDVFRRRARAATEAAGLCWLVGKANGHFLGGSGPRVKDLAAHFGVSPPSVSQRGNILLRAGGFDTKEYGTVDLGSPDYLTAERRRSILERRDRWSA